MDAYILKSRSFERTSEKSSASNADRIFLISASANSSVEVPTNERLGTMSINSTASSKIELSMAWSRIRRPDDRGEVQFPDQSSLGRSPVGLPDDCGGGAGFECIRVEARGSLQADNIPGAADRCNRSGVRRFDCGGAMIMDVGGDEEVAAGVKRVTTDGCACWTAEG